MVVWDSSNIKTKNHQGNHDPRGPHEDEPASTQARLRSVARAGTFRGDCWALLQAHRCSW